MFGSSIDAVELSVPEKAPGAPRMVASTALAPATTRSPISSITKTGFRDELDERISGAS